MFVTWSQLIFHELGFETRWWHKLRGSRFYVLCEEALQLVLSSI
jgi:hypothetical protein